MLRRPTVLIVGAGASAEFGMPIGAGLADSISRVLDANAIGGPRAERNVVGPVVYDIEFRRQLEATKTWTAEEIDTAFLAISTGVRTARSIDEFLSRHENNQSIMQIGKHAIARAILKAERGTTLLRRHVTRPLRHEIPFLPATWLGQFFHVLTEGVSRAKLDDLFKNISIVTFNYDRIIEYFILGALMSGYRLTQAEAYGVLVKARIVHVYGAVGVLAPPDQSIAPTAIQFGAEDTEIDNRLMGNGIKIYTESDATPPQDISTLIDTAETAVFLGMAYHDANMRLLRSEGGTSLGKIFGTAHGFSAHDIEVIKQQVRALYWHEPGTPPATSWIAKCPIEIPRDKKASELFQEYSKSIST